MSVLDFWPCWHAHGWECALEFSVQGASGTTRAQAKARYANESGEDWRAIGVWKRHLRKLDRIDKWVWWVENNDWRDDETGGGWDTHPDLPPEDWQPDPYDEDMPAWEFVHASHPDAIPVWVCGALADGAPHRPARPSVPPARKEQPDA